ncbi:MAG: SMC-Scp complex subunit ScpB [Oscillospiraceae bacterium]|nr:SMC-Scp complex subunit ScpB [Oscillospiraceae bacterium]MBR2978190.1 SMC-Scp complex subunit ScpB [Oscillospiraceae bacterium]MBR3849541.1 SMC-Scp complex subunit ScpB [Oscillospiraceae bacterium]
MEQNDLQRAVMAILFAAGESVPAARIAQAMEVDVDEIHEACRYLMDQLSFARSGIRILKLADAYQMCSSSEMADFVTRALETRKPPKLSASQLEALTVIAYYQPATKAVVEQIRGVDSSYSVSALLNKHLIEDCGRLNVPGRPILYRTTPDFLRTFGLSDLSELPEIERVSLTVDSDQLQLNTDETEAPQNTEGENENG